MIVFLKSSFKGNFYDHKPIIEIFICILIRYFHIQEIEDDDFFYEQDEEAANENQQYISDEKMNVPYKDEQDSFFDEEPDDEMVAQVEESD